MTMNALQRRFDQLIARCELKFQRFIYDEIDWTQPLIGIMGQRGVGKTTLMLQRIKLAFKDTDKAFYASLDNIWFGDHTLIDLAEMLSEKGVTHLFLDEVHRYPGWQLQVKNIYDTFPDLYIVFTSSSLLELDHSIGDLSRRASMHYLPGLSFREFIAIEGLETPRRLSLSDILLSHEKIAYEISRKLDVISLFKKYSEVGYYPFYKTMTRNDYYSRLDQIISTVIDLDIPAVENIEYETLLKAKRLIGIVAGVTPYQPNFTSLAGQMDTNWKQLAKLFNLLDRAGIFRQLFAGGRNPASLAKAQKVLMNNPAIMYALDTPQIGAVRESVFAAMLSVGHKLTNPKQGDFMVDGRYLFEIGGKNKGFNQIKDLPDSFVVCDDTAVGFANKIPLWIFGLLY